MDIPVISSALIGGCVKQKGEYMSVGSCSSCSSSASYVNPAKERNIAEVQKDIVAATQQQAQINFQPDPSKVLDISA